MLKQKTTWAAIGSAISALGLAVATKDYAAIVPALFSALGLAVAADH